MCVHARLPLQLPVIQTNLQYPIPIRVYILVSTYACTQVYASGRDIVILDGRLKHVQTLLGSDIGYGETPINCVHCAELVGKIAVAWGSDVVIFLPEPLDDNQGQNINEVHVHTVSVELCTW